MGGLAGRGRGPRSLTKCHSRRCSVGWGRFPTAPLTSSGGARMSSDKVLVDHDRARRFHLPHTHLDSVFGSDWFGVRAEGFARFFGTPTFLIAQTIIVAIWIWACNRSQTARASRWIDRIVFFLPIFQNPCYIRFFRVWRQAWNRNQNQGGGL